MPIAWCLKRWWKFCMSEDGKKEVETIFKSNTYNVLKHFATQRLYIVNKSL